jgi:hypothetical protein
MGGKPVTAAMLEAGMAGDGGGVMPGGLLGKPKKSPKAALASARPRLSYR